MPTAAAEKPQRQPYLYQPRAQDHADEGADVDAHVKERSPRHVVPRLR